MTVTDLQVLQALASRERAVATVAELAQQIAASEGLILDIAHRLTERQLATTAALADGQIQVMITAEGRRHLAAQSGLGAGSGLGRVHEGVSINELVDYYILRDAIRAGGSIAYDPGQLIHDTDYLSKVLDAAEILTQRGQLVVDPGFTRAGTGPLRLTLTDSGRRVAEAILDDDRRREATQVVPGPPGFSLFVQPGDAPPDVVADVLAALSSLHRAAGGSGLSFEVSGDLVEAVPHEAT